MATVDKLTISILCSGPGGYPLLGKTVYAIASLTSGNIVAQTSAAAALATRTQELTLGVVGGTSISVDAPISSAYPAESANRGSKWIISARNAAGQPYTYTIPAPDPGTGGGGAIPNVSADGVTADFASTGWTNYIGAFQAVAVDRAGGPLTVTRAKLGGRRR